MGFILVLLSNPLALYLAQRFVPGFIVNGGLKEYLIAGILIGLLNLLVRPILKLISLPLIVITLGLFLLVINALVLWIASQVTDIIVIQNLMALLWATLIITAVNFIARKIF